MWLLDGPTGLSSYLILITFLFKTDLLYCRLVWNFYHSWRWLWTDLPSFALGWEGCATTPGYCCARHGTQDSHPLGKPSAHSYALMANVSLLSESVSLVWGVHWDEIRRTSKKPSKCCGQSVQQEQGLHSQQVAVESRRSEALTITSSILPSEVSSHKHSCFSR